MTSETLLHIKRKRHAWNKYLATRRMEDFEEYKRVRNGTNDYVKNTKRDYERCISQTVKKNQNSFGDMLRVRLNLRWGIQLKE